MERLGTIQPHRPQRPHPIHSLRLDAILVLHPHRPRQDHRPDRTRRQRSSLGRQPRTPLERGWHRQAIEPVYMTETASYLPQKEGAGSIMHLRSHIKVNIKAYQAQWVIKYLDPRRAPWKEVLDNWILHDNSTTTRPSAEASSSHNHATDTRAASTTSPTPAPSHAPASSPSTNS